MPIDKPPTRYSDAHYRYLQKAITKGVCDGILNSILYISAAAVSVIFITKLFS